MVTVQLLPKPITMEVGPASKRRIERRGVGNRRWVCVQDGKELEHTKSRTREGAIRKLHGRTGI